MKFINTTLLLIALLFNASILFGAFDIYYDHFKIVTYGALLLIVLLMICKPSEMQNIIDPLPSLRSFTFN